MSEFRKPFVQAVPIFFKLRRSESLNVLEQNGTRLDLGNNVRRQQETYRGRRPLRVACLQYSMADKATHTPHRVSQ